MDTVGFIASLVPAFTAGLAVQRFIEIGDPIVNRLVSQENKALALGLLSVAVGLGLAFGVDLHVLLADYAAASSQLKFVDHLATGLLISAGTEGFNSLLKFATYKKEEQKTETAKERVSLNHALISGVATLNEEKTMDIDDVFKNTLQDRVRRFKQNPALVLDFKNGALSQHIATNDQARTVVLEATQVAATRFERSLNSNGRQIVRSSISTSTKYGDAVRVMENAVANGSDPQENIG